MLILSALLSSGQVALSSYALYFSVISIRKLRRYEKISEQAAQYSNTADEQLQRTRTTQGAGAIAVSLLIASFLLPSSSSSQGHAQLHALHHYFHVYICLSLMSRHLYSNPPTQH